MSLNFTPGDWDLTPLDLATLFLFKGWEYATENLGYGVPTEEEIKRLFAELVADVASDGRPGVMVGRGRFLAARHSGMDSSVDMYLHVGHVWAHEVMDDDEYEALGEMGLIDGYDEDEEYGNE